MPALLIAIMLLLAGCSSGSQPATAPAINQETPAAITQTTPTAINKCEQRQAAIDYMATVEAEMKAKDLEDSEEFLAFKDAYWETFNEEHEWCDICN